MKIDSSQYNPLRVILDMVITHRTPRELTEAEVPGLFTQLALAGVYIEDEEEGIKVVELLAESGILDVVLEPTGKDEYIIKVGNPINGKD